MNSLAPLLSSRVRAELFRLLFGTPPRELHLRDLARRAGLNEATVRQDLKLLGAMHLVNLRRDGNRAYYSANASNPLYPEIRGLVLKTCGLADVLREALGADGIRIAFVFGSIAGGVEKAESDVDLMVIGSITLRQVAGRLSGVTGRLGREINPHVFTPKEFASRIESGDHFVSAVMEAPKLFLIGDDDELAGLGR